MANCACNLLAKHDVRFALADEAKELGPEITGVFIPVVFARRAVRLTGATSGPNSSIVWPIGELQGSAPASDSCKEVALGIFFDFIRLYLGYGAFVDIALRD